MSVEAPVSKYKKHNLIIYIVACLALGVWCYYDGYINQEWIDRHTNADGNPTPYLMFNRKAPPFFVGAAVLLGIYLLAIRKKKIVALENEMVIANGEKIPYDAIHKIDKTYFQSKGFFTITYKRADGREVVRKFSDHDYDNLGLLLDELVAKIS